MRVINSILDELDTMLDVAMAAYASLRPLRRAYFARQTDPFPLSAPEAAAKAIIYATAEQDSQDDHFPAAIGGCAR